MGKLELIDFLEVHYEVSVFIHEDLNRYEDTNVVREYWGSGHGGLYELAHEWTKEFHEMTSDRSWDGEFFDELHNFLNAKNKVS